MKQTPEHHRPVFIVGTGRCGSTIVDSLLAMHPDFSWMSSWIDTFPRWPVLALANRIWAIPALDRFRLARIFPTPVEPYDTFRNYAAHFNSEGLDPDLVQEAQERLVPLIESVRRYHGRPRFLGKLVGRPVKIDLFSRLFPNATFVHVRRGLKPTLCSLMRIHFYSNWGDLKGWHWDALPDEQLEFYKAHGEGEEIATAIRLRLNNVAVADQLAALNHERVIDVEYAEFVRSPVDQVATIASRLGLTIDASLERRMKAREVYGGADDKWKTFFSQEQIERLDEFETRFGYERL